MHDSVWILDDDRSIRTVLDMALSAEGYQVRTFSDADEALNLLEAGTPPPGVVLTDIRMPGTDGLRALKWLHTRLPELPVIVMTAHSDLDAAVASYQKGAFDYLPKPFDIDEVKLLVRSATLKNTQSAATASPAPINQQEPDIIGKSAAMQEVFRAIGRLSHSAVTVLINGSSGTGKERVARALHHHSSRRDKPFIAINMAAIPRELIESELFGHERGAFTGANSQRIGRFEQASGGTLFLDEIGDMPLETQTRLLRVLQENEFFRIGGTTPIKVDVRIIAATHQNLEKQVEDKQFRQDLFYRLNVIRIHLPDLAQRREDISQLANYFLGECANEMEIEPKQLTSQALSRLEQLPWPGNIRQLENLCRWFTVMVSGKKIHPEDLPEELRHQTVSAEGTAIDNGNWQECLARWASSQIENGHDALIDTAQPVFERTLLNVALAKTHGHKQKAASLLGWGRNTLTRKLKELPESTPELPL